MTMKQTIILAVATIIGAASTASAEVWTLDRCIGYALDHNLTVRARQMEADKGRIEVTSAKNAFLPTVTAGANETFDFGRSVANDNMKVSANSSSFSWNVNAQLPVRWTQERAPPQDCQALALTAAAPDRCRTR